MNSRPVLVLNKLWTPVGIVTLQRAITMLYTEYAASISRDREPKAYVVDPDNFATFSWDDWSQFKPAEGEDFISSVRDSFKIPEVIVLSRYDKMPKHRVTFSRRSIYKRDNYTCQYCGKRPGPEELTIDHVTPRARGGQTTWTNCVLACFDCNSKKADKTLKEAGLKLRREPFKPEYQLIKSRVVCDSWKSFISEAYWEVEMVNDEPSEVAKPKKKKKRKKKRKK
jgi:5-methylcytosine-specific restriction endonuclease McrA